MKKTKLLLTLLLVLIPFLGVSAQGEEVRVPQFGFLSYSEVFEQMPEYKQAQDDFAALKAKYDAETMRSEDEFQRKFADFLQGQKDFPPSILQKRQAELQELMEKSVAFRKESRKLLKQAEAELQRPVAQKLDEAIKAVGAELGLIFVLNTDGNALPFIHPQVGVNITQPVLLKLGIELKKENPEVPQLPAEP
ncbi:MAG: OmpH family outer membrane protein [Bacteroidales bacterium]|nr:OmpH family outer membrane protein [Bacteroidales bacterium]